MNEDTLPHANYWNVRLDYSFHIPPNIRGEKRREGLPKLSNIKRKGKNIFSTVFYINMTVLT